MKLFTALIILKSGFSEHLSSSTEDLKVESLRSLGQILYWFQISLHITEEPEPRWHI